jgi:hypothetical protein
MVRFDEQCGGQAWKHAEDKEPETEFCAHRELDY